MSQLSPTVNGDSLPTFYNRSFQSEQYWNTTGSLPGPKLKWLLAVFERFLTFTCVACYPLSLSSDEDKLWKSMSRSEWMIHLIKTHPTINAASYPGKPVVNGKPSVGFLLSRSTFESGFSILRCFDIARSPVRFPRSACTSQWMNSSKSS